MAADLWGPINLRHWRDTPHVAGRLATEADALAGRAVYFAEVGEERLPNTVYEMSLPAAAMLREESGEVPVIIIQAEMGPNGVLIGYRPLDGGNGICVLDDIVLLERPDSRFVTQG